MSYVKRKVNKKCSEYIPKKPNKYKGRYPIVVRSSWERLFCQWLDANESVLEWSSEMHTIRYYDPIQKKRRRYFPDFWMRVNTTEGIKEYLIEVKPYKETQPPKPSNRKSHRTRLTEEATYVTNMAKFEAAEKYCKKMGLIWRVMTEKELFGK